MMSSTKFGAVASKRTKPSFIPENSKLPSSSNHESMDKLSGNFPERRGHKDKYSLRNGITIEENLNSAAHQHIKHNRYSSFVEMEQTDYYHTGLHPSNSQEYVKYKNHPYEILEKKRRLRAEKEILGNQLRNESELDGNNNEKSNSNTTYIDISNDSYLLGYAPGDKKKRRILQEEDEETVPDESAFRPMRIKFFTEALQDQENVANSDRIKFIIKEILPRTGEFWTKTLGVVPVDGKLRVNTAFLSNGMYCGDSEFTRVPNEHISQGVSDVDLILYVSATPSTRFCGPSTLAVAVACNFDMFDRPTVGAINVCLEQVEIDKATGTASPSVIQDNVDVLIHEAAHVLGMSSNSFRFFRDSITGRPLTERPFKYTAVTCVDEVERNVMLPNANTLRFFIADNGQRYATIVTPKVATVARNQFDCQLLQGAPLENQPTGSQSCTGDHWEERLFYSEALSGVISPTTNLISPLTLALMEDSGWYKANYSLARIIPWGHGRGCDFVSKPCIVPNNEGIVSIPDYGKGFFCTQSAVRGCSSELTHKMACTVLNYDLYFPVVLPPDNMAYFRDQPTQGGPRQADYCPLYGSTYAGLTPEQLDCREPNNLDSLNFYGEFYGENSMCFESSRGEGLCYFSQCILDERVLKVFIRNTWLTCEYDFQKVELETSSGVLGGSVTCPRLSSACPDMFCPANCAGRGTCDFSNVVNGTVAAKCLCDDETDTSPGCSESLVLDGKYVQNSGGLSILLSQGFFDPLVSVFIDHPDLWTTESWAWAAGLFAILLLMILCICSSFWPQKPKKRKRKRSKSRDRRDHRRAAF